MNKIIVRDSIDIPFDFTGIVEYPDRKLWLKDRKSHREDGPAVEFADGTKQWWFEGHLHRLDGPAVEFADGRKYWYVEELLHRLDGPAFEHSNGTKGWYIGNMKYIKSEFRKVSVRFWEIQRGNSGLTLKEVNERVCLEFRHK